MEMTTEQVTEHITEAMNSMKTQQRILMKHLISTQQELHEQLQVKVRTQLEALTNVAEKMTQKLIMLEENQHRIMQEIDELKHERSVKEQNAMQREKSQNCNISRVKIREMVTSEHSLKDEKPPERRSSRLEEKRQKWRTKIDKSAEKMCFRCRRIGHVMRNCTDNTSSLSRPNINIVIHEGVMTNTEKDTATDTKANTCRNDLIKKTESVGV